MAQRALIKHYFGYVKSICLRYSNDDQDADEILNDSFLKVFSNLLKYDKSQPFKGWIRTITVNTAIDHYRKSIRIPENESIDNLQVFDLDADIIDQLSAEEILQMVRSLTPAYRMVFSLYAIEGYSHKEIAEFLGIKEGTSKSNLQDARRKLQAMMFKQNPTLYSAYEMKKSTRDEE
jgi:RNA polymerase sigma-70 factor (ECF subfamily)